MSARSSTAVNDLDNVLYEISNESTGSTANTTWQYHMINYVKSYEAAKPKQHPGGHDRHLAQLLQHRPHNSPADWISLGSNVNIDTYVPRQPPATRSSWPTPTTYAASAATASGSGRASPAVRTPSLWMSTTRPPPAGAAFLASHRQ